MSFYVYETTKLKGADVMKEVVTVTREQAERIEDLMLNDVSNFRTTVALQLTKGWATKANQCLNDMDPLVFIGIVAGTLDYEIEAPPWKPKEGEWAVRTRSSAGGMVPEGLLIEVRTVNDTEVYDKKEGKLHLIKNLRPATPEEVMWGELGRQPGEFKEGDRGVTRNTDTWHNIEAIKRQYDAGNLKGFYPVESFIEFKGE